MGIENWLAAAFQAMVMDDRVPL